MKHDGQRALWHREIADTTLQIASFRVDPKGELLITDNGGGFYRLVPLPKSSGPPRSRPASARSAFFASIRENRP